MATDVDPIAGSWYQLSDKSQLFEVISLDEDTGLVEIQYLDGDQEELDLDTWYELDVEPTDAPEEWIGSIDDLAGHRRYAEAETDEGTRSGPSGKRRRREWEDTDADDDEDSLNKEDSDEERWDLDDED